MPKFFKAITTIESAAELLETLQRLQFKGSSKIRAAIVENVERKIKDRLPSFTLAIWERLNLIEVNDLIFSNLKEFSEAGGKAGIYTIMRMLEKNPMPRSEKFEEQMQNNRSLLGGLFRAYVTATKKPIQWFEDWITELVEKDFKSKELVSFALHYGQEVYGGIPTIWKDWILGQLHTFKV